MHKPKTVIRKYGNRRLYDTTASRYVNLEDIAQMVREGTDVEVRDARSGEDVTRVILTQIIVEDARDKGTGLPLQFLRQLVVASDRATHEFLSWYLGTTLDMYHKAQEAFRSRFTEARQAVANPVEFLRNLVATQPVSPSSEVLEIEELSRRIQELESRLSTSEKSAKRKRAKARKPTRRSPV